MTSEDIKLSPIGHVIVDGQGFSLQIDLPYRTALRGLEGFSHVVVLWWCHQLDNPECRRIVECPQPYRKAPATLGIFATRSPVRPNPIALTPVPVLNIAHETGLVRVAFIDAENDSPILDLKPYHPATDRIRNVSVPGWCAHWPQWYEESATFDWAGEFVNAR
jgi:tRNA (adenine37-N6)-methyltransferase